MDRIFERRRRLPLPSKQPQEKYCWAIVGSGPNKAAADEIRIKLSELCYKTISSILSRIRSISIYPPNL